MCYSVIFGSFATNTVHINRKEPQKLGSAGTLPPWGVGAGEHLKTSPLPICVTTSNLVVQHKRVCA